MNVIVIYASKYGSNEGIAEFIAEKIREQWIPAVAQSVDSHPDPEKYDAVVIGSAVFLGAWMKDAVEFVKRNRTVLAARPERLFSSGPLKLEKGVTVIDDPKWEAKEIAELREAIHPRDHRIFLGALNPDRLGFVQRAMRKLPAARAILPEGDFRDRPTIEARATSIAHALKASEHQ